MGVFSYPRMTRKEKVLIAVALIVLRFSLQKDFTDDCVFNENMELHNYNTYSSTYNSNARRKYYLALNRHGEPRKLQIPPTRSLEEHNCQRGPQALRKKANSTPGALGPKREQKCRELLLQQQQAQVAEVILPPMCNKMAGHKKSNNNSNQKRPNNIKNGFAMDILNLGHNNRRGKKLNVNGRQAAKLHPMNGFRKRPKNPKRGNNNNNNRKKQQGTTQKTTTANTSPPSTSPKLITSTTSSRSTTIITTTTTTTRPRFWETTSLIPTTTVFDNFDFQTETTSDRGEREQRNVHFPSSIEESIETSAEEHLITDNEDSEIDNDDLEVNEEIDEVSYDDDLYTASSSSSSHLPLTNIDTNTPLTGGAEDFLYYDQLDFLPLSLWELTALLWIIAWSLYGMEPA
uniref:Uncharacterized protein n=1 Tax=Glossina palpalis gambiensis TaxID=67801 RepID=A0A1B0B7A3_9MUSC